MLARRQRFSHAAKVRITSSLYLGHCSSDATFCVACSCLHRRLSRLVLCMAGLSATSSGEQRLRFGNFDDELDVLDEDNSRAVSDPAARQAVSPPAEGRTVRCKVMQ